MENSLTTIELVHKVPTLAPRPSDSNKGSFGRVLVVAGSRGMSGAAVLCGSAALRGGAGLVCMAVPEGVLMEVAIGNPCYLTLALVQDDNGVVAERAVERLMPLCQASDVVAVGPGLNRGSGVQTVLTAMLTNVTKPMVIDADALNQLPLEYLRARIAPSVLTPHPGEFARLLGSDTAKVQARRQELACQFAADYGVTLVLKGHQTIVTDGRRSYRNETGNPGMATGGTGDVLTGLIAALIGQRLDPFSAAQLGVYLHGLAGDRARDEKTEACLIASDLLDFLPAAFRMHMAR
jgi:NAD(P)H-hydrate epimerase